MTSGLRCAAAACLYIAGTGALMRGRVRGAEQAWRRGLAVLGPAPSRPLGARLAADCLSGLSRLASTAGRYDDGLALARAGLGLRPLPARVEAALHNHAGIALRLGGRHAEAGPAYAAAEKLLRHRSLAAAAVLHNRAGLAFAEGDLAAAERLARRSLALTRRAPLQAAGDRGMLGVIVAEQGRFDEGERLLREALAAFERRLGAEHREIAIALGNLAEVRRTRGDLEAARELAGRALAVGERTMGRAHPELAPIARTLARASSVGDTS